MLRAGELLAAHDRHQIPIAGMERITDGSVTRRTPGIMTLDRTGRERLICWLPSLSPADSDALRTPL
jgi:hypothetical protein